MEATPKRTPAILHWSPADLHVFAPTTRNRRRRTKLYVYPKTTVNTRRRAVRWFWRIYAQLTGEGSIVVYKNVSAIYNLRAYQYSYCWTQANHRRTRIGRKKA